MSKFTIGYSIFCVILFALIPESWYFLPCAYTIIVGWCLGTSIRKRENIRQYIENSSIVLIIIWTTTLAVYFSFYAKYVFAVLIILFANRVIHNFKIMYKDVVKEF